MDIGLHITLTQENPISQPQEIKSLLGNDGSFYGNIYEFLIRYLLGKIKGEEIKREIRAQFEKISSLGIKVTHIDSHQHVHILPGIIEIVIEMCREYNINYIRCRYGPLAFKKNYRMDRFFLQLVLNMLCLSASKKIKMSNLKTCNRCFGFLASGNLNEIELKEMILSLKDGLYEIICHPGMTDTDFLNRYGHWHYNWGGELQALCSVELKNFLKDNSVLVSNFKTLR